MTKLKVTVLLLLTLNFISENEFFVHGKRQNEYPTSSYNGNAGNSRTTTRSSSVSGSSYSQGNIQSIIGEPLVEAIYPKGLRVSLPHIDGMEFFAFHGKVNSPITQAESGNLAKDVRFPQNGRWVYEDSDVQLRIGDVLNYWIFVQVNGQGHRLNNLSTIIREYATNTPGRPDNQDRISGSGVVSPSIGLQPFSCDNSDCRTSSSSSSSPSGGGRPSSNYPPTRVNNNNNNCNQPKCSCTREQYETISTQLNVTITQLSSLNDRIVPLQTQVDSLNELVQEFIKDMNIGTKLLLIGQPPPGTNTLEAVRQLIVEKLDLVDLENNIRSAQRSNNEITFEMTSAVDKKRILLRAKKRLHNSNLKIKDPQEEYDKGGYQQQQQYAQQNSGNHESNQMKKGRPQQQTGQYPNYNANDGNQNQAQYYEDSSDNQNYNNYYSQTTEKTSDNYNQQQYSNYQSNSESNPAYSSPYEQHQGSSTSTNISRQPQQQQQATDKQNSRTTSNTSSSSNSRPNSNQRNSSTRSNPSSQQTATRQAAQTQSRKTSTTTHRNPSGSSNGHSFESISFFSN